MVSVNEIMEEALETIWPLKGRMVTIETTDGKEYIGKVTDVVLATGDHLNRVTLDSICHIAGRHIVCIRYL